MRCKICNSNSKSFGQGTILKKYKVTYWQCEICGFVQTDEPYWLTEAYSDAITKADIGLIGRNLQMSAKTRSLIQTCFDPTGNFVDFGGGYGLFVRLMRDKGFGFYRYDPHCKNLFAEGFEASPSTEFSLLTAWEVFEHLQYPLNEIEKMLSFSPNLFFSTILMPSKPKPLNEWWYYGLEHGQHISFFTLESLRIIAQKFNIKLYYSNGSIHFMGNSTINPLQIKVVFDHRYRWLKRFIAKPAPPSLIDQDYYFITGKILK